MSSSSIPVKLLHEAEKHEVVIELKTGELYKGKLIQCEENMNCQLSDVEATSKQGQKSRMEHVFLRGSYIRLFILPEMLKNASLFKKVEQLQQTKARPWGAGRGKPAAKK